MNTPKVHESEYKLCEVIWENEPIKSGDLARLCYQVLGWKTTTTYTVIKRLSQRGVVKNEKSIVTSLVSRDEVQAAEIDSLVERRFAGSLPAFIAAFAKHQQLTDSEVDELHAMIDRCRNGESDG